MYKRILVPVDGSPTSMWGLAEAVKLAKGLNAKLRLVHVVDEFIVDPSLGLGYYAGPIIDSMREGGRKILEAAEAYVVARDLEPETQLIETIGGRAADSLVADAKENRVDLIVMGTHGRRGLRRLVMGSDAELVLRSAPVPVLLVRESGKDT